MTEIGDGWNFVNIEANHFDRLQHVLQQPLGPRVYAQSFEDLALLEFVFVLLRYVVCVLQDLDSLLLKGLGNSFLQTQLDVIVVDLRGLAYFGFGVAAMLAGLLLFLCEFLGNIADFVIQVVDFAAVNVVIKVISVALAHDLAVRVRDLDLLVLLVANLTLKQSLADFNQLKCLLLIELKLEVDLVANASVEVQLVSQLL